jgi:hypothetical protein
METLMNRGITRGLRLLAVAAVALGVFAGATSAASAKVVVYNNIAGTLPGNYASIGYAATSTSQYGGEIELAGTARKNPTVTVAMSAWACQYGNSSTSTCTTPKPKKKFKWPLTLNVYEAASGGTVGAKLASVTKEFGMPYRPSVTPACARAPYNDPGAWFDSASNSCFHGLAFTEKFHVSGVTLPPQVILSLSYDTSNYGPAPVGAKACEEEPQGCYYDSLNFADVEPAEAAELGAQAVGSDPTESQFVSSNWNEMYCGSSASLDTFGPSGVCPSWYEGDQPAIRVEAG